MVGLLLIAASRVDRLDVLVLLLFAGNGFLGLVIPATSVLAMEDYGEFAGTASALMGTLQETPHGQHDKLILESAGGTTCLALSGRTPQRANPVSTWEPYLPSGEP